MKTLVTQKQEIRQVTYMLTYTECKTLVSNTIHLMHKVVVAIVSF